PTGASLDAAYYDTGGSRTGWYALAAFMALVALVVGGVLLFQALSQDETADEPTTFVLQDYVNQPLPDVIAELEELQLFYTTEAEPNPSVPENFVHRTVPAAGEIVLPNTEILVFFNPAQELLQIPNVQGVELAEAQARLQGLGFVIGEITFADDSDFAENTVLSTEPSGGTAVPQGTVVSLVVAGADTSVQVPAVVNQTESAARQTLENPPFDFVVTSEVVDSETVPAGTVISIEPTVGSPTEQGSEVVITVSGGPPPVIVPPVEGLTQGQATNQLRNACGSVVSGDDCIVVNVEFQEVTPGSTDDGRVISQDPSASAVLERGSTVTIVVGRSLELATTLPPTTLPPATTTTEPAPDTTLAPPPATDPPATDPPPTDPPPTDPPTSPPTTDPGDGT
ncbi:MAG: PASTA domain-containing protein, partial [Actinomycetota bacterium]